MKKAIHKNEAKKYFIAFISFSEASSPKVRCALKLIYNSNSSIIIFKALC